ncbi:uncharacterized protein LOC141631332 [Silene latifolia]|uniref:uncharacterized protein LOC141631332 n=1 Tax=Silene latifolia TaxID=37657 RepID=UPI003D77B66D
MTVLWGLWALRNKAKFENVSLNSQVISGFLFGLIREKAHLLSDHIDGSGSMICSKRNRENGLDDMKSEIKDGYPLQLIGKQDRCDVIRVQVDASWNRNYDAAFGWVAYDWRGCEVMRRQKRIKAESALQAEALGVRDVLIWASSGGFLHLQISSDCLQLINELAGAEKANHLISDLLEEMWGLSSIFHCLCFVFIPRHLNSIAHGLAYQAMRL